MGSSTSKAARTANNTIRKYPTRIPPQPTTARPTNAPPARPAPEASRGPTVHPQTRASGSRGQAINNDASDPDLDAAYNARLSQIGPVQTSPTMSHSSTFNNPTSRHNPPPSHSFQSPQGNFQPSASSPSQSIFPARTNPAIALLQARERLAQEAEEEFQSVGRRGAAGRRFLDVVTIRQVLMMRDDLRKGDEEIEKQLGLGEGVVGKLGPRGLVSGAGV